MDDDGLLLYHGHPGQVVHINKHPSVDVVSFVNGPSIDFSETHELRQITFEEYLRRGRRLVAHIHPVEDRPVQTLCDPGSEWPEGAEPSDAQVRLRRQPMGWGRERRSAPWALSAPGEAERDAGKHQPRGDARARRDAHSILAVISRSGERRRRA